MRIGMADRAEDDQLLPAAGLSSALYYTLQPIVDANSGLVYGYEGLLRGTDGAGSDSIDSFFNKAHAAGELGRTELALMQLAMTTYRRLPHKDEKKLFLNIDGRAFDDPDFAIAEIGAIADRTGVCRSSLCLELSEKHNLSAADTIAPLIARLRLQGLRLAVDDFGQGFSELKLLYEATPEYVKIDRFFVSGIDRSSRKRLFVSTVVNLAHTLGARVVAEGVETREEYLVCRHAGCDLVQGWYLARPIRDVATAPAMYPNALLRLDRSVSAPARPEPVIDADIDLVEPVPISAGLDQLIQRFHMRPERTLMPVVDAGGEPLGLIFERDLRAFRATRFGREVLANGAFSKGLKDFIVRAPIVDAASAVEDIVEALASNTDAEAVILTRGLRYAGVLSARVLLRILHERRTHGAQNHNPLSMLPGRAAIYGQLIDAGSTEKRLACCFDFNHFKPFNDSYGFRHGDRAIMLFADILRRSFDSIGAFLGHGGGDDFYAATTSADAEAFEAAVRAAITTFRHQIESFYEAEDRDRGYLKAFDPLGREQLFPIMTCSAAILVIPAGRPITSIAHFDRLATTVKRAAKLTCDGVVTHVVD